MQCHFSARKLVCVTLFFLFFFDCVKLWKLVFNIRKVACAIKFDCSEGYTQISMYSKTSTCTLSACVCACSVVVAQSLQCRVHYHGDNKMFSFR